MSDLDNKGKFAAGVWSAAPTPFNAKMEIDVGAVRRMVAHHIRLGVRGLFLGGTNGEGPWMTDAQRRLLVRSVARSTRKRMRLAVQVTDNSAARIVDNINRAAEDGADIAVIAPPYFPPRKNPDTLLKLYLNAIDRSCLPIGIYDRAMVGGGLVPDDVMQAVLMRNKVIMLKDSSANMERMQRAVAVKRRRHNLQLLNGWEFNCLPYLQAGYDGLLLGGGVFNGYLAGQIVAAAAAGQWARAARLQRKMNRMMYAVYGGQKITCWLSGEKYLLTRMGVIGGWRNYPDYPLTAACRKAIARVLRADAAWLFP